MKTYTHDYCRKIKTLRTGCARYAGHAGDCTNAGLGVGHVWTITACPAYRTLNGSDCTCSTTTH